MSSRRTLPLLPAALISFGFFFSSHSALGAKNLHPAYLKLKDCPDHPGCPAIVLLDETVFNYDRRWPWYTRHQIIKFFTPEGVQEYSDIEATALRGEWEIATMGGRTILPDGTEVPLKKSDISAKTLREGKRKFKVKSAKFPAVIPGAIVEWTYEYRMDGSVFKTFDTWVLQRDIPVLQTRYILKPGLRHYSWTQTGLQEVDFKEKRVDRSTWMFSAIKIPPVAVEPMGPPSWVVRSQVRFYPTKSAEDWLKYFATSMAMILAGILEDSHDVSSTVQEIVGSDDSDLEKARKIYLFIQRNFGSDEERLEEKDPAHLEDPDSVKEILERGYGNEFERTLLFLALAKEAGLEHGLLLLSSRSNGPFNSEFPNPGLFDSFAATVKIGNEWRTIDPATPFCPFGMVSPEKERDARNGILIRPEKDAGIEFTRDFIKGLLINYKFAPFYFVDVPSSPSGNNTLSREASVSLKPDGSADIELLEKGKGHFGLSFRDRFGSLEGSDRRDLLSKNLERVIPGAEILNASFENLDSYRELPSIRCKMRVPALASFIGGRLAFSPSIFHSGSPNLFVSETRKTPVYFPFAQANVERILIRIPEEFVLEEIPEPVVVEDPPFQFTMSFFETPEGVRVFRRLIVDTLIWPAEDYQRLKTLYETIWEADRRLILLRKRDAG